MPTLITNLRAFIERLDLPEERRSQSQSEHRSGVDLESVDLVTEVVSRLTGGQLAGRHVVGIAWLPQNHFLMPRLTVQSLRNLMTDNSVEQTLPYIVTSNLHEWDSYLPLEQRPISITRFEDQVTRELAVMSPEVRSALLEAVREPVNLDEDAQLLAMEEGIASAIVTPVNRPAVTNNRTAITVGTGRTTTQRPRLFRSSYSNTTRSLVPYWRTSRNLHQYSLLSERYALGTDLYITRGNELQTIMRFSMDNERYALGPIHYRNESGVDQKGLTRSAFTEALRQLIPCRLVVQDDQGDYKVSHLDYLPSGTVEERIEQFRGMGHLFARCFEVNNYSYFVTDMPFSNQLYEELMALRAWKTDESVKTVVEELVSALLSNSERSEQARLFRNVLTDPKNFDQFQKLLSDAHLQLELDVDLSKLPDKMTSWITALHLPLPAALFLEQLSLRYGCESLEESVKELQTILAPKIAISVGYFEVMDRLTITEKPETAQQLRDRIFQPNSLATEIEGADSPDHFFGNRFELNRILTDYQGEEVTILENCVAFICRFLSTDKIDPNNHQVVWSAEETARLFTQFATGNRALTNGMKIRLNFIPNSSDYLPVSHACTPQIDISINYFVEGAEYEKFERNMIYGISESESFLIS